MGRCWPSQGHWHVCPTRSSICCKSALDSDDDLLSLFGVVLEISRGAAGTPKTASDFANRLQCRTAGDREADLLPDPRTQASCALQRLSVGFRRKWAEQHSGSWVPCPESSVHHVPVVAFLLPLPNLAVSFSISLYCFPPLQFRRQPVTRVKKKKELECQLLDDPTKHVILPWWFASRAHL